MWEQRISAKWQAFWAVRMPKAEEVPIATSASRDKDRETTKGKPSFYHTQRSPHHYRRHTERHAS